VSAECRRSSALAGFTCLMLGLAGCAAGPHPTRSPHPTDVRLDVPLVTQQDPNQCGLAALSMVVGYYDRKLSEQQQLELLALTARQGALTGENLAQALRGDGYYVAVFRGGADDSMTGLRHHLSRGRPLIVMLRHPGEGQAGHHYVVVTGHVGASGAWLVADPLAGRRSIDAKAFQTAWDGASRFTILAMPVTTG
jgi:ABC-type bacteriocin/lantibiotic exporter with double-glycine peptidase domain